jgi:hypothetical protein
VTCAMANLLALVPIRILLEDADIFDDVCAVLCLPAGDHKGSPLQLNELMNELSLPCFEARVHFVDDVKPAFSANYFAVFISFFCRFKRVVNFHRKSSEFFKGK